MAYNIGQFRRTSNLNDYYENIIANNIQIEQFTKEKISENNLQIFFENPYYDLSDINNIISKQNYYYLKFSVKKLNSAQNFYLKLENFNEEDSLEEEENQQIIANFNVPKKILQTGDEWVTFEIIIAPNNNYKQLYWDLTRTLLDDYRTDSIQTTENIMGRKMDIIINQFAVIKNIIQDINKVIKVGIQGPPSFLMCINGEQIRIGKTGIFEINEDDFIISFIGFIPKIKNNVLEYFIMDYEYI